MDCLYIVIPAYNEEENISRVIEDWYPIVAKHDSMGKSRLTIINDGSKDKTGEIARASMAGRPLLEVIDKQNGGHGETVLFGYRHAIEAGADYIFQTDSDGQTDPGQFEEFWEQREAYSAIFGNRASRQDGAFRVFTAGVLRTVIRVIFQVKLKDANAPYRLMKAEALGKYIDKLPSDFFLPNVMINTYMAYYREPVKYIDISFKPRVAGVNTINVKKIFKVGIRAVKDFYKLRKEL